MDYITRWATAQTVARFLRSKGLLRVTQWGVTGLQYIGPRTTFVSEIFRELCAQWMVTPKLTTAYHPQTNMTKSVVLEDVQLLPA